MSDRDKVAMAAGVYAVSRTIPQWKPAEEDADSKALLRLHCSEGIRVSPSMKLIAN